MTIKRIFLFLVGLSLGALATRAQSVDLNSFYAQADGKKKAELKNAFHDIIGYADVLAYGGGNGKTWFGFYQTDRMADNEVRDRYSYEHHYFTAGQYTSVTGMDIEHSFPKSWWGGDENQAYRDIHHLMPCESRINRSKSNNGMGKVTEITTNNGCSKVGKGPGALGELIYLWEPADEWKGDFARAVFYMVTCYQNLTWTGDRALESLTNSDWPTLQPWAYELYLQWNREDPVDDIEIARNEAVYRIQHNRNPFIDYPSLAEYIWGDSIDYEFDVSLPHRIDGSTMPHPDYANTLTIDVTSLDWTEDTHETYGEGFTATTRGLTLGYYKNASRTALVNVSQYSQLRLYKGSVFVITGADLKSVKVYGLTGYLNPLEIDGEIYTFDEDKELLWEGETEAFTALASEGQVRFTSLMVVLGNNGDGPGPGPEPLDSTLLLYQAFRSAGPGSFTMVKANGTQSQVWAYDNRYGMVANAYSYGRTGDEWLISPAIDLTGQQGATLEFRHAVGYNNGGDASTMFEVLVSNNYAQQPSSATWTRLDPEWPTELLSATSKFTGFISSGRLSLDDFAGETINIAFHYRATSSQCWAWEIDGFQVYGLPLPTGIDDNYMSPVAAEDAVFDMNGRYVGTEVPRRRGIYIVRQGGYTYKRFVK